MILECFTDRKLVTDDKLWEMIRRANRLTQGSYRDWNANSGTLIPLLKRILVRAKEAGELQIYFYAMSQALWYVRRDDVNDIRFAFQLSEMFHQAYAEELADRTTRFGREFFVDMAVNILSLYDGYPQISDEKLQQMLSIFLECEQKYGTPWNAGSYEKILRMALFYGDLELAEKAKKKLTRVDYDNWCYVCYYVRPMIEYYLYMDDYDVVEEMISAVERKEMPRKYLWCYDKCEHADTETLVMETLANCMVFGRTAIFQKVFERWKELFETPVEGHILTVQALLHVLAGDLSRLEDAYRVAESDDRKRREQRLEPYDAMDWSLWWHFYFDLLAKHGVESAEMDLGEGTETYSCGELSAYFERQADAIGAQMSRVRKRFDYGRMKGFHEECIRSVL